MKLQKLNLSGIVIVSFFLMAMAGCSQPEPEPPHVHTFSNDWTLDDTAHWHAATCGHSEEVKGEELHKFPETWTEVTAATEEADGLEERFCEVCNYRATQVIPQLKHKHDIATTWTIDSTKHWHTASCGREEHNEDVAEHIWNHEDYQYDSVSGKNIKTCTVCLYVDDIAHVHTEDRGSVTTVPTCVTKGVKTFKCSVCNAVLRTEEITATGHTEDSGTVTTAPTCGTKGVKTFKCSVCDAVLRTEDIPATGLHTEDRGTVTTDGIRTYKCIVCKAILRTEKLKCYEFTKTVKVLPAGTDGTAGPSATYVEFGDWPQSVLPSDSTVTVDETVFVEMGVNTYYLGSDGNYYAKCAEKAYLTGTQYKYHDGTQAGRDGTTTRYFKVEPIKWRVLTDNYSGKKLLLAEEILTANVPYYDYNSSSNKRTVGSETKISPNNYKYSQIRAYLNGLDYYYDTSSTETTIKTDYTGKGFLQTAFTQDAQALIAETVVDNRKETTGYSESTYAVKYACENTTDKIFLLSESEVINSDYGFESYNSHGKGNARIRVPTDYAKANYAYQYSTDGYGGYWWLRSPYWDDSYNARYIVYDGRADYEFRVHNTNYGVVPALSISF